MSHSKNHTGAEFCTGAIAAEDGAMKIRAAYLEEKWLWLIRRLPRRNLDGRPKTSVLYLESRRLAFPRRPEGN